MTKKNETTSETSLSSSEHISIEGLDAELKILPLNIILPDPNNPRVHTEENIKEIAESIKTLGFNNPIQVVPIEGDSEHKYKIVAGHGRYEALESLGIKVVPSFILKHLEGDDARAMAANIADNEIALHSFYDEEKLATALNELQELSEQLVEASGIDMDRFLDIAYGNSFTEEDTFELNDTTCSSFKKDVNDINKIGNNSPTKFDDFIKENIKPRDVFKVGNLEHRLMYGDASDAVDMEMLMGGDNVSADLLITDARPLNKGERRDSYRVYMTEMFGIAKEILNRNGKAGGNFYVLYPNDVTLEVLNALEDAKMYREQNLVWVMNNMLVSGKYDYRWLHENIAFGKSNDGKDYNPIVHQDIAYGFTEKKLKSWNNDKRQPSVIQIDANSTTKPLKLVGYFIKNHLEVGGNILDFLAGSGTGLIASDQLHRHYFGIDNDSEAILTALCRFAQDTHYEQPIINERTNENITEKIKNLLK